MVPSINIFLLWSRFVIIVRWREREKNLFLKILMVRSMDLCYFSTFSHFASFARSLLIIAQLYFFLHHFFIFACLKPLFNPSQSTTMSVFSIRFVSMLSDSLIGNSCCIDLHSAWRKILSQTWWNRHWDRSTYVTTPLPGSSRLITIVILCSVLRLILFSSSVGISSGRFLLV